MARGKNHHKKNNSVVRNNTRNTAVQKNNFPEHQNNFRTISLYPEKEDICSNQPKLCSLETTGPYRSTEHYLDVNFKVLREDFINPLRQAIKVYRQKCKEGGSLKINNIEIYKNVKFISNNKVCFDVEDEIKADRETTKRFMTGSLLMFTYNNFETFFLATVANTEINDLKRKFLNVELINKDQYETFVLDKYFTMIESEFFFTPYYHVLKAFQELNESNFPFKKYIVDVNVELHPPTYLNNSDIYIIKSGVNEIEFNVLNNKKWPTPSQLGLDISQFEALKAALKNELAIIQAPPGTGKISIGLKIVEVLLANSGIWNCNSTPILVVCVSNHALDQFLEGMLSFTTRLVRVGKSEEGKLDRFNLRVKRKQRVGRHQGDTSTDLKILRSSLVVGTTTTQVAKQRELFKSLASKIVIVEEAAEVLEAHIIASLTMECQHLILIGDHKQIKPSVSDRVRSAQQYKLDVSLFERLIQNDMPSCMLILQHRMRPEISQLLINTIYPSLQNHPSVFGRENIKGMDKNVFFLTHGRTEEEVDGTSKKNEFEAMFLLSLAKYLVKQGYKPQEITILATYKGQTNYMEQKRESCGLHSGVQITTVDNFQHEENKIILLSLVRSNRQNDVGFLKTENRICVALSRARDGFYIVGNMDCLIVGSDLWRVIKDTLSEQKSYGPSLPLRCQVHKDQVSRIMRPEDISPGGGCSLPCDQELSCGHICKSKCHGPSPGQNVHRRCMQCARVEEERHAECCWCTLL